MVDNIKLVIKAYCCNDYLAFWDGNVFQSAGGVHKTVGVIGGSGSATVVIHLAQALDGSLVSSLSPKIRYSPYNSLFIPFNGSAKIGFASC